MSRIARPHWSFSSVNQYLRCPLQFYFERVLKLPRGTVGSGLVLGSSVHEALAVYHIGLQNDEAVTRDRLIEVVSSTWSAQEAERPIGFKSGESKDSLIEKAVSLVDLYVAEPPPVEIVKVEETVLVPLHNSDGEYLETPLVAKADLIIRSEGKIRIQEFKTSARAYSNFEVDSSLQATCYVNAVKHSFGEDAEVEFVVLIKTKTPKLQRITVERTDDDLSRLGDLVETVERAVENEVFYPVESPLNCSGCSFRNECRQWRPKKRTRESSPADSIEFAAC